MKYSSVDRNTFFYILFFNEPLKHYNKSISFDFELKGVYIRGFDNRKLFFTAVKWA